MQRASSIPMQTAAALRLSHLSQEQTSSRDYHAFGGVLRSEIDFPELRATTSCVQPDWTLIVEPGRPPYRALTRKGERRVREELYRLWESAEGFRLEYSHAGTFDISKDGRLIVWYHDESALMELVRNIVLGPAIALALELAGNFCLHGSAVALEGGAVAFVAPKHFGKSTLATALTTFGAQLIGDDLLVVHPGPPATTVRPGIASVRLWPDVAAALSLDEVCRTIIPGVKTIATGFGDEAVAMSPCGLAAVYVLAPVMPSILGACAASRTRLERTEATVALAHHTKLPDSLIGLGGAGTRLAMAAAVAANVPVWKLNLVRDISRLDAVVRQIIDWSLAE